MDNKEAIERLHWVRKRICDITYSPESFEALGLAIKALKETQQDEWVPVSEKLPEEKINPRTNDFEEVLCTTVWGDVRSYKFGTPIGHDEPHFWCLGEIWDMYITAWQYKPEPYKEGDQE